MMLSGRQVQWRSPLPHPELPLELLEFVPSAICLVDERCEVEWENAAARAFSSGSGFPWDDLVGETGQRFEEICRGVLESGLPHAVADAETTIRRRPEDGDQRAYVSWSVHRVRLPDQMQWSLLAMAQETTRRVTATREAQDGEQLYRELFRCNPHPMWIYDIDTLAFLEVNDAAVAQYGFAREEFESMTIADIRPAADLEAMRAAVRAARNSVLSTAAVWRHLRVDGSELDVEISSHAIRFRGREARLVLAHEVTRQLRAEAQLVESETLNRLTIEHAAVGIAHVTPDGRFAKVNAKLCEILGYSESELLDLTFQEITAPDDLRVDLELLQQVLAGQKSHYTLEKRYVRKDGSMLRALLTVSLVRDAAGAPVRFISIVEDMTWRDAADAERERLQSQLSQAQKLESVGRLAGGVAHDFNNMLNVILGYTELALLDVDADSELSGHLHQIANAAKRSAGITAQLLAFARKQPVVARRMQLNSAVEWSLKMLRRLLGEEVTLLWLPGADVWPVMMDPVQLDQVLANLVTNARDALDGPGKVTLETRNREVEADEAAQLAIPPGEYVELSVSDDGPGFTNEVLPHLFEPFFTTKPLGRGTGLGLATVFGIVTQHRGHIRVVSPPGQGATVTVLLPADSVEGPSTEPPVERASLPRGHETVLVVEDEHALLSLVRGMLTSLGYRVLSAELPSIAHRLAVESEEPIDLILTDVVMPEQRGPALAATIVQRWPAARVLFMSGYPGPSKDRQLDGLEGDAILAKPFTLEALAQRVRAALDAPR